MAARGERTAGKTSEVGSIQTFPNENIEAFSQGLGEAGYVDGQNILLETRFHRGVLESD